MFVLIFVEKRRFRTVLPSVLCTSTPTSLAPFSALYVLLTAPVLYQAVHGFNYKLAFSLTPSPAPPVMLAIDVGGVQADCPEGMVLLDTLMRYGEISYDDEDVQSWDQRWHPSEKTVQDLGRDWRSIPVAKVLFISNGVGGVYCKVFKVVKPRECFEKVKGCTSECFEKIKGCTIATFHCIRGALISFYEWLRKKCHKNCEDDVYLIART